MSTDAIASLKLLVARKTYRNEHLYDLNNELYLRSEDEVDSSSF